MYRTHTSKQITEKMLGKKVTLAGWVSTIRDHGGIFFVDLRDHYGVVQLKAENKTLLDGVNKESVISATGTIVERTAGTENAKLASGKVELKIDSLVVLSRCQQALPFEIEASMNVTEDTRLKFRYLDLRNPKMQANMKLRSEFIFDCRTIMRGLDFEEFQTPILTASSPEGARDYIVPSRLHKGKFFALPQAPQQFKQLLMVAGMDKYFQIAPCFRDEDPRADRHSGEFYQLDAEMSFSGGEDARQVLEVVLDKLLKKYATKTFDRPPYKKISYKEAMVKYGTDKPDLRNPIVLADFTEVFANSAFSAFAGKTVRGFAIDASQQSKSFFEKLTDYMLNAGAKGLAWVRVEEDNLKGPIIKFISKQECDGMVKACGAKVGQDIFIIADSNANCCRLASLLRTKVAETLGLINTTRHSICWITDFPMFEKGEDGKITFSHNPFSMPMGGAAALETDNLLDITADQFDLVVDGVEVLSGAVRNNQLETMEKVFNILGYTKEDLIEKFGAMYNAFEFGVPPHAGWALGIDRFLMLISGSQSLRDMILFPLNGKGEDKMCGAPAQVTEKQLREAHIKLR